MDAFWYLTIPHPAATKFVSVTALVEQDVPGFQAQIFDLVLSRFYFFDYREVEVTPLHVCNSKVRYGP